MMMIMTNCIMIYNDIWRRKFEAMILTVYLEARMKTYDGYSDNQWLNHTSERTWVMSSTKWLLGLKLMWSTIHDDWDDICIQWWCFYFETMTMSDLLGRVWFIWLKLIHNEDNNYRNDLMSVSIQYSFRHLSNIMRMRILRWHSICDTQKLW